MRSDAENALVQLIPEHMHECIRTWIDKGEPHPSLFGDFLHAVLTNNMMESFARADWRNFAAMHGWVKFLYNYAPSVCYGSEQKLLDWYEAHHPSQQEIAS